MKAVYPCKDCTARYSGCHDHCMQYKSYGDSIKPERAEIEKKRNQEHVFKYMEFRERHLKKRG